MSSAERISCSDQPLRGWLDRPHTRRAARQPGPGTIGRFEQEKGFRQTVADRLERRRRVIAKDARPRIIGGQRRGVRADTRATDVVQRRKSRDGFARGERWTNGESQRRLGNALIRGRVPGDFWIERAGKVSPAERYEDRRQPTQSPLGWKVSDHGAGRKRLLLLRVMPESLHGEPAQVFLAARSIRFCATLRDKGEEHPESE